MYKVLIVHEIVIIGVKCRNIDSSILLHFLKQSGTNFERLYQCWSNIGLICSSCRLFLLHVVNGEWLTLSAYEWPWCVGVKKSVAVSKVDGNSCDLGGVKKHSSGPVLAGTWAESPPPFQSCMRPPPDGRPQHGVAQSTPSMHRCHIHVCHRVDAPGSGAQFQIHEMLLSFLSSVLIRHLKIINKYDKNLEN